MNNQEVLYERTLTGSYMKIAAPAEGVFEERVILKRELKGLLPVQRCQIDGRNWFWYDISGKQSLDTFCNIKAIDHVFMERLIVSICDQVERLEWNLLDQNSLLLAPEYIYIGNVNPEIFYTVCPGNTSDLSAQFQQLMEYLLTKIDHRDGEAVRAAYEIYERTLDEAYGLMDLRDSILESKTRKAQEQAEGKSPIRTVKEVKEHGEPQHKKEVILAAAEKRNRGMEDRFDRLLHMIFGWQGKWKKKFFSLKKRKETVTMKPSFPPDQQRKQLIPQPPTTPDPTICLTDYREAPRGLFIYEGPERLENIRLEQREQIIGSSGESEVVIPKNTVSHIHARISYRDSSFVLEDLNSTNGTYINEEILEYKKKYSLKINDTVRFADVRYRFL